MHETLYLNLSKKFENLTVDIITNVKMNNRQETANAHMKTRYDLNHKLLFFRLEDKVFLRLHKNYEIKEQHKKLNNKRCESFLIK